MHLTAEVQTSLSTTNKDDFRRERKMVMPPTTNPNNPKIVGKTIGRLNIDKNKNNHNHNFLS